MVAQFESSLHKGDGNGGGVGKFLLEKGGGRQNGEGLSRNGAVAILH